MRRTSSSEAQKGTTSGCPRQQVPDNRCQSPHWGYVVGGRIAFRYADREEVYETGDAYYAPLGHVPLIDAGTEVVEFSPTDELGRTMEVVARNLEAAAV